MVGHRWKAAFALGVLGVAACSLAACGRSGPLELPPGPALAQPGPNAAAPQAVPAPAQSSMVGAPVASAPTAIETAQKNGFDAYGNPVAAPGQKKSFFLDFLLQ